MSTYGRVHFNGGHWHAIDDPYLCEGVWDRGMGRGMGQGYGSGLWVEVWVRVWVTLALKQQPIILARANLTKKHWFHALPFQQFQALLILCSKSFSPFPHGTSLLSVSNLYLALDEIYHPLCAPIPRNVTL